MKKIIFVNFSVIAGILSMMLLVSCGGGGSTSSGGGTASGAMVQGNVASFNGVAMFAPDSNPSRLAHALESLSDRVMFTANALEGVQVEIAGQIAFTDADGEFSVEGIPAGTYDVILTYNGAMASVPIVIPENAEEVYLDNMQVEGSNIFIGGIRVEVDDNPSNDDVSSADSTSSDDDPSSDDTASSDDDPSSDDTVSSDDDSSAATTA
jgi:hypothetical protein